MRKFEYKCVLYFPTMGKVKTEEIESVANKLGSDGWEMVGFTVFPAGSMAGGSGTMVFKREKL